MPDVATLTLILAHGTAEVLPELHDPVARAWLARAAARGSLRSLRRQNGHGSDHLDWEWQLLAASGLLDRADELASAPLCRAAENDTDGFWVRAEPMHFAAGLSRMDAVVLRGAAALRVDERQELADTLGAYVRSIGMQWDDAAEWLIGLPRALDVQTRQPNAAASTELEMAMPTGPDSRELRRLMTELQMVLHEHPVNESRARSGLPAANAVWLWGAGALTGVRSSQLSASVFGNAAFVRGLGRTLGIGTAAARSWDQVSRDVHGTEVIVTVDVRESMNLCELWLIPLQRALNAARLHKLCVGVDRWRIELTRAGRWRVWRRDVPIDQWSAA